MLTKKTPSNSPYEKPDHSIETDTPLSEKDEEGAAIERMRNLQKKALGLWHGIKKKKKKK